MNPEFILGRSVSKQCVHASARGILIMKTVLEHPERTLTEIAHNMYCMFKQDVAINSNTILCGLGCVPACTHFC